MAKFRTKTGLTSRAAATALAVAIGLAVALPAGPRASSAALPDRLEDAAFWKLETDISEPGGYFRITDNFTSNEPEIGQVFTMLRERGIHGGVYLGVGPEQNFTYMAAIRPAMAFIIDIRRQAVMQHLMFKAVFELAKDRADFISLLFSKPRPAGLDASSAIQQIWTAYTPVGTDEALARRNHTRIVERLTKTHGFTLTDDEKSELDWVINAFVQFGPAITTRGSMGYGRGGNNVTFADLTGWSTDASGQPQSFLSSEDNYQFVKALEERNLVVPVSGDFGGPKALRAVGAYLKGQHAVVSAFYLSNVEQYLFQDRKQQVFYDNVAELPTDEQSVFIRPYSLRGRYGARVEPLCGIQAFLSAVKAGHVYSNNDAQSCAQ